MTEGLVRRPLTRTVGLHEAFEARAHEVPDATAVVCGDEVWSYRALSREAQRIADQLLRSGVAGGAFVAVLMRRSPRQIAALLGVLKVGAAYVPLDPEWPEERIASVLREVDPAAVVRDPWPREKLPDVLRGNAANGPLAFSAHGHDPPSQSTRQGEHRFAPRRTHPQSLACVMYTSGSTQGPKGVAVSHSAVTHLVLETDYVHLDRSDRVAQASNTAFDASTFEIWGALLNGATLVILARETLLSPRELAARLRTEAITVLFVTTALFNRLACELPDVFAPLRSLLFGGERVDPRSVRRVLEHGPPERLVHVYGPTEATTFATWQRVTEVAESAETVPIGGPVTGAELHLLDDALRPVAAGAVAELYIGGEKLASYYHGDRGLTARRFVPDPLGGRRGARLYRTGDLVRNLDDVRLAYVTRLDHQVKIRGYRIELGEIEAALEGHPDVSRAVVVARAAEDGDGEQRLVGHVVPAAAAAGGGAALRRFVRERLPEFMVPAVVIGLDELPLDSNGKVDRAALPEHGRRERATDIGFVAARNETEATLARMVAMLLGLEAVGIGDDFFELGGSSLQAIRLVFQANRHFNVECAVAGFLWQPTVAALAASVAAARGAAAGAAPSDPTGSLPAGEVESPLRKLLLDCD